MSTVKEAITMLNEKHCHPAKHHVAMVNMDYLPKDLAYDNTAHDLMKQTYDWRYDFVKSDKDEYTVTLTKENVKYLGNAIEVYNRIMFELYLEPELKSIISKMGDANNE